MYGPQTIQVTEAVA